MKRFLALFVSVLCMCGLCACSNNKGGGAISGNMITPMPTTTAEEETVSTAAPGKDSMTASLVDIDMVNMQIIAKDIYSGENYVLSFNGGTDVKNMFDEVISMQQVAEGEIVDITFDGEKKKAKTIYENKEAFRTGNVLGFKATTSKQTITFGSASYFYTDTLVVLSSGRQLEPTEIMSKDQVTVRGIGNKIYSVSVDKGHGYLAFTGTDAFVGGMVEIGRNYVYTVVENMVVVVPEGEYEVVMSNDGIEATKNVYISKDMTATMDFREYVKPVNKTASVEFNILPKGTDLYIEGEKKDYSSLIPLEYGTYIINLVSDEYPTYTTKLVVSSAYQIEDFDLAKVNAGSGQNETEASTEKVTSSATETTTEAETTDDEETTSSEESTTASGVMVKLTISAPEGAGVYIDNVYVGTAPVTVSKNAGEYVITFKRDGYQTKSYIVDVESSDGEQTLSFPEMSKE